MDDTGPFIRRVEVREPEEIDRGRFPWTLPSVGSLLAGLELDPGVTFLVGENGSGKSTLIEAFAVAAGMNPEGGSSNFSFSTRESHSSLAQELRLQRTLRRPRTDFFLRAESFFTAATYLESLEDSPLAAYGGRSLHEQSHGESFLALLTKRFGPDGLYLLDEPEAALSAQNCLTCLRRMNQLVEEGSQFIVATHSPILLAYPGALIYECSDDGLRRVEYDDAEPVRVTRGFLAAPERFLDLLLGD
jgi:predicted ATPase